MHPSLEPHSPGGSSKGLWLAPTGHIPQARRFPWTLWPRFPTNCKVGMIIPVFRGKCSITPQGAWLLISVEQRHKPGCAKSLPVDLTGSQLCKAGQSGGPAAVGEWGAAAYPPPRVGTGYERVRAVHLKTAPPGAGPERAGRRTGDWGRTQGMLTRGALRLLSQLLWLLCRRAL